MKHNRIIAAVLTAVILLGVMPFTAYAADWGAGDTLEDALSELKVAFDSTNLDWLVLPGLGVIKLRYSYFLFKNERTGTIDEHPVFCVDPTRGGAHEIVQNVGPNTDGSQTATYIRGVKVGDARYKSILGAGYPHVQYAGLGLQSLEEAYYATKLALWMYVRGNDPTKLTINPAYGDSDPVALRVRNAAITVYNNGMKSQQGVAPQLTLTGKPSATAKLDETGEYYVQGIEVHSSGWVGENPSACGDVQLSWDSPPPAGTIVLGSDGEDITSILNVKMSKGNGLGYSGKVTVKYPAAQIDIETFSSPTLIAEALIPNDEIYVAYAQADKDRYQRYLVERDPKIEISASFVSQLSFEPVDVDYPSDSGLRIRKLETGTLIPLEGAVFEVRDSDGKLIYSLATDETGIIDIPLSVTGNYTVTEVTPPQYHLLPDVRTQSVYVNYGEVAEVTFTDAPYGTLRVVKRDAANGQPLGGAAVRIRNITTNTTQEGFTDSSGCAVFEKLPVGAYEIVEMTAPDGYALDSTPHTVNVVPLSEGETSYTLTNKANPGLRITKFDRQTMTPIEGVSFEVWKDGELYGTYVTDAWGEIELRNLPAGTYTAREFATVAPYVLDATAQWIELHAGQGYISELYFFNLLKPGISLVKIDSETFEPLVSAKFLIKHVGGTYEKEFTTDANGEINLSELEPGAYTVQEITAPNGYLIDDAIRTIQINGGENAQFVFTNTRKPTLRILKVDAVTGKPLPNAEFRVSKAEGLTVSEYITDETGEILVENLDAAIYNAEEFMPPDGYIRYDKSKQIQLVPGKTSTLKFDNVRKPVVIFLKTNGLTGKGIPGAAFKVEYETPGGGLKNIGSFKTGADGRIVIPKAEAGWYIFTETHPAPGYSLPKNPVTRMYFAPGDNAYLAEFEQLYTGQTTGDASPSAPSETSGQTEARSGSEYYTEGEGFNWPLNSIVIKKSNAITGELLAGAAFELYRADEQVSGVPGTNIGRYTTDHSGVIVITGLDPGFYIVKEVQPPQNFLISENSMQNGYLKPDGTTVLEFAFANYPYGSLLISKIDAVTGVPLGGARFKVTDSTGAVIGSSNGEYVTDSRGEILIPNIRPGAVVVTEIQAPAGYAISATPQTIQIGTDGKTYKLTFDNYPYGGLQILKLDEETRRPIAGVEFAVSEMNGKQLGTYRTDDQGRITLPEVTDGWYTATEVKAAKGYLIDTIPHNIEVKNGKTAVLTVTNRKTSGIIIHKIDSVTKKGVYGVTFLLYDENNKPIGQYESDQDGYVYIGSGLADGKYKIRELTPASGYAPDDTVRTIYLEYGRTTEITWENVALKGQIIVTKRSAQYNEVTGLPAGSPLSGAVFEVYSTAGNLVDRMVSDAKGVAASQPIPLGMYFVKEVSPPKYYALNPREFFAELKHNGDIVRFELLDENISLGVTIQKKSQNQATPGQIIYYDLFNIANTSSSALENFYVHDRLPTDAVRGSKLFTGTWSDRLTYRVMFKTNYSSDYRVLASGLNTKTNYELSVHPNVLGLQNGEYVTDIRWEFGTVPAGFRSAENPKLMVQILPTLPKDYRIVNRADAGGLYIGQWETAQTSWTTIVIGGYDPPVLPKTGH